MILAAYEDEKIAPQVSYIFQLFAQIYRVSLNITPYQELPVTNTRTEKVLLSYGRQKPLWSSSQVHIYSSNFWGNDYLTEQSLPTTPLPRYHDLPVIYTGCHDRKEPFLYFNDNHIETNIDFIASSFFLVTRYEEVVIKDKIILDEHERFPAKASLAYKENFLHRPLVNEYFELLWNCLKKLGIYQKHKQPWKGKEFVACLTHDVDAFKKYHFFSEAMTIGGMFLKQHQLKKAANRMIDYTKVLLGLKADPFNTFDYLLGIEKKYNAVSSFYFLPELDYSGGDYILTSKDLKNTLHKINDSGSEIGLHAGYYSFNNWKLMKKQKEKLEGILNTKNLGCRQHFLRWKTPDTWLCQEKCGIIYDTTLCFADHEGFRAGLCHPFKPFDLLRNNVINLWEVPLTIITLKQILILLLP
ncbi:MAG: polysaccharide deacetylase family protein, partial [Firmicutes bacterium]|nr:polysaccharide deacetylase family protein [Bacillota bacterium]